MLICNKIGEFFNIFKDLTVFLVYIIKEDMIKNKMSSAERVKAALAGDDFDVYPVISPMPIATIDAMEIAKAFYPSVYSNAAEMAELAATGHDCFGFDTVTPYFSSHLEAAALGAEVDWKDAYHVPEVVKAPFNSLDDFKIPQSFLHKPELQHLLRACEILRKKYYGRVPIIGKVIGPWTLVSLLYSLENMVLDTILAPEKLKKLISEIAIIPIKFAEAQFNAGADMVTWVDSISSDLVSAAVYEDFLFPVHKKAAASLQSRGTLILHIGGNVMDRFNSIIKTGFKVFHMNSKNDISTAIKQAKSLITITGCINIQDTLSQGSPETIRAEVEANIKKGVRLISPEGSLPVTIPGKNLKHLVESAHRLKPQNLNL